MDELTGQMELVPVTMKNIMEVATIASNFSHFEAASSALLLSCAKYFQLHVIKGQDLMKFMVAQHKEVNKTVALSLLSVVESLPPLECSNCSEIECLKGNLVTPSMIVEGLKVQVNKALTGHWAVWWADRHFTAVDVNTATRTYKLKENNSDAISGPYARTYSNISTLIYDC